MSIKDTYQYMADMDGLNESLPRGEGPTPKTRHKQIARFSFADESDRMRLARPTPFNKTRFPF
ncbi:hypothetical protein HFO33_34310 [Rhizobium leguminosarum]|uniref:hypothetical protein n=1 Tax=Rhizobium leguminosarum TaxID=384 RepID=UPI001C96048C|nr:hypothetical protein [Rhizobium leguminosarum]MBY5667374.1 hypothetical protein [Rhizobium leguminosarum]MBY5710120.1 hypothetical protein [Rhizobium leguminosarum]MBY5721572.1 hypothetical protein [Rhizobium leguminosarum]